MVFIGAFIVFATFIAKEGFRDRWKENGDAMDMAQYVYDMHQGLNRVEAEIQRADQNAGNKNINQTESNIDLTEDIGNLKIQLDDLELLLARTSGEQLGEDFQKQWIKLKNDAEKLDKEVSRDDPTYQTKLHELQFRTGGIGTNARVFTGMALDLAKTERKEFEHKSTVAWSITLFLFIFGWGLGLVGKLYGLPGASGGE
jgi:hypothetical protein